MINTSLYEISKLIVSDDRKAFYQLYTMFHKQIFSFCLNYGINRADAEEITQESFVKLWCNRQNIQVDKSIKSYLFKIAQNLILDFLRKKSKEVALDKYQMQLMTPSNSTQDTVEYNELRDIMEQILANLPERRRMVFEMARLKGMSHKEIAERLGISTKTVENHLSLATQGFKEVLKNAKLTAFILFGELILSLI
ncbi:DNA-directed RNA polymerase sigma-70 factor [Echinicola pacifica]|uniref:DNA-directed RNA polymerase sigma-70 factor n=1 Tax=Echinicola pacifica TaxID=346377 RepID=A0A918Q1C0_9BACT|nr:RNA polymerase sigma-70 factor [Echinicola pacifica]GGZ30553.1 DNA-directed RNA polymerase sigma-70 factor [Echinicola pacifica]